MKKTISFSLIITVGLAGVNQLHKPQPTKPFTKQVQLTKDPNTIIKYILQQDFQHSSLMAAQAILESGNFKSKLYMDYNNMFGMKHPKRRKTYSKKHNKTEFAVYSDWMFSVQDYLLWVEEYDAKHMTREQYINLLSERYAEDKSYIKKLLRIEGQLLGA